MRYILCLLLLSGCGAAYLPAANEYFEVLEARSFEEQEAGQENPVTHFNFKLHITTHEKLAFDTVWVRNQGYPVKVSKSALADGDILIAKNDTIILRATNRVRKPDPVEESSYETPGPPPGVTNKAPVSYKGQALLRYYVEGDTKYHPIAGMSSGRLQ
jgi:hypothetical protein